ncbi:SDR family NAD(P)-dependent oxidoreductase [Aeromicrobium sp. 9AM]|uniref:SDR family NAD(P)-dependent oxidoreductase n=1 Tax=Aeromicrobium sp. 9AM TaxID=2653126 RepID=UPI0012F43A43|nr:SDR family oxidoreductase [Aeromicrobium sp. 9AM]VXB63384.1 2-(R)-hydroxypropyl-CoM dehydrogenase [Aeromicrobium sp. 9AM]
MDMQLAGRAALVTGAASGIGRATAFALAREGMRVALCDRDTHGLEDVAAALAATGTEVLLATADVGDERQVARAVTATAGQWGQLDTLVCCAGISGPFGLSVDEITTAEWAAVMAVNVTAPFLFVKHTLPLLRASDVASIVLMASDSSFVAAPGMVPYVTSKGAVLQLTRALSVDLVPDGVRVNCVCPSIVDTPMSRSDLGADGFASLDCPVQTPDQVASQVVHLASPVSAAVNGHALVSDFGYLARSSFPA